MRSASLPLPGVLAEIAHVAGRDAAEAIARAHGGTRVYIPAKPIEGHWLTALVGRDNAAAICTALVSAQSGVHLLIPIGPWNSKRAHWQMMARLIDEGLPKRQIARALNVHERTVQAHRNGQRKTVSASLSQFDLFEV